MDNLEESGTAVDAQGAIVPVDEGAIVPVDEGAIVTVKPKSALTTTQKEMKQEYERDRRLSLKLASVVRGMRLSDCPRCSIQAPFCGFRFRKKLTAGAPK